MGGVIADRGETKGLSLYIDQNFTSHHEEKHIQEVVWNATGNTINFLEEIEKRYKSISRLLFDPVLFHSNNFL